MRQGDVRQQVVRKGEGVSEDKDLEQVKLGVDRVFEERLEAVDTLRKWSGVSPFAPSYGTPYLVDELVEPVLVKPFDAFLDELLQALFDFGRRSVHGPVREVHAALGERLGREAEMFGQQVAFQRPRGLRQPA